MHDAPRQQHTPPPTAELFTLYEGKVQGTRPDRLSAVWLQLWVQQHTVFDVPALPTVEQLLGAASWKRVPVPQLVELLAGKEQELYSLFQFQHRRWDERVLGDVKL